MAELHQFTDGWIIPAFGYTLSLLGALAAVGCTARARRGGGWPGRIGLLALGAWSMGGIALWSMHMVALIGFSVTGTAVRHDPADAARGLAGAVAAAGVALCVIGFGRMGGVRVLVAGLLAGIAVAGSHYADVRAMRLGGAVDVQRPLVAASFAVAILLSMMALWWAFLVGGRAGRVIGSAIMGAAAGCAHYIGMAALRVHVPAVGGTPDLPGLSVNLYLAPVVLFVASVAIALAYLAVAAPARDRVPANHASAPVQRLASEQPGRRRASGAPVRGLVSEA